MTKKFREIIKGVQLEKQSSSITYDSSTEGGLYNNNDEGIRAHIEGADREVVTDTQTQTVTNKSIDADNNTAKMEEKIRRQLIIGPKTER